MIRLLTRPQEVAAVRIWQRPDWPAGDLPDTGIAVEWQRQAGHPTSYALLGGFPAEESELAVAQDGLNFTDALAGAADHVRFGLPDEYRAATVEALRARWFAAVATVAKFPLVTEDSIFDGVAVLTRADPEQA